jgi:parallel beta-helix repeat protein
MAKKKKNSTSNVLKGMFEDKYLIIFLVIVLVVAINHLVFSSLLGSDRLKAGAQAINYLTCGQVITTPGTTWYLSGNLDCTSLGTTGIIIDADNVTIDGQGYTIDGDIKDIFAGDATDFMPTYNEYDPSTWQWGIASVDHSNLTIKNLHIANFYGGIVVASLSTSLTGITIQNNTITNDVPYNLSFVKPPGIFVVAVDGALITQNNISGMGSPITLYTVLNSTISNNTISGAWGNGISVENSSANLTIANNTIKSGFGTALKIDGGCTNNNVTDNDIIYNHKVISNPDVSTIFTGNTYAHNIDNAMIYEYLADVPRNIGLNDTVNFQFGLQDSFGNLCPTCTYSLAVNPPVTLYNVVQGNDGFGRPVVDGSFDATIAGTYSLQIGVSDGSNTAYRNKMFYVDPVGNEVSTYYFRAKEDNYPRAGFNSTHGQPKGRDDGAFLLTPPLENETEMCSKFVLNTIDELPDYPMGLVTDQNLSFWHKEDFGLQNGIKRFGTAGAGNFTAQASVSTSPTYTFSTGEAVFSGLTNWAMDYPFAWYLMTYQYGKILQPDAFPYIQTRPEAPSTNVITHVYPTTPAIKSFSNTDILLLAAHPSAVNSAHNTIILDGTYASDNSVDVTLDSYNYPFGFATTRINSDGTATLKATNVTGKTTYDSVNMAITPDSGYVDTTIITWDVNNGQNYYKKWSESGSLPNINTAHVIADMQPNTSYYIKVDGSLAGQADADGIGIINFNYDGGYSTHVFEIVSVAPTGGIQVTEDMLADSESLTLGGGEEPVAPGQIILPGDLQVSDVIKSVNSNSVFVVTSEGKRNVFPHETVFRSYFTDFNNIKAVSDNIISQLPIGKNITMRPGTNLIKLQTNPSVYAVEPGGIIRMLENEEMAATFFGENWAHRVVDVSDAFWPDYIEGDPLESGIFPTATVLRYLGNSDVLYVENGEVRLVSLEVFAANNYQEKYVVSNVMKNSFDYDEAEKLGVVDMFANN